MWGWADCILNVGVDLIQCVLSLVWKMYMLVEVWRDIAHLTVNSLGIYSQVGNVWGQFLHTAVVVDVNTQNNLSGVTVKCADPAGTKM